LVLDKRWKRASRLGAVSYEQFSALFWAEYFKRNIFFDADLRLIVMIIQQLRC